jgi:hypothetical protein
VFVVYSILFVVSLPQSKITLFLCIMDYSTGLTLPTPFLVALTLTQVFPSSFNYSLNAAGEVVVATPRDLFTAANLKKFDCLWEDKVNTAFFRGTATGMFCSVRCVWGVCVV